MSVTARLENWTVDNKSGCLIGEIHEDTGNRGWPDGTRIKTSKMLHTIVTGKQIGRAHV